MPSDKKPRGRVPVFHTLLVFRCPTTLSEALAEQAAQQGTSISEVIRTLLLAGLEAERTCAASITIAGRVASAADVT